MSLIAEHLMGKEEIQGVKNVFSSGMFMQWKNDVEKPQIQNKEKPQVLSSSGCDFWMQKPRILDKSQAPDSERRFIYEKRSCHEYRTELYGGKSHGFWTEVKEAKKKRFTGEKCDCQDPNIERDCKDAKAPKTEPSWGILGLRRAGGPKETVKWFQKQI